MLYKCYYVSTIILKYKHESFISNIFFSINNNKIFKENLK